MRKFGLVLAAVAVFCFVAFAQKPVATSSVTGHVTCADSNTPARLAIVVLRPVPAAKSADSTAASNPVEARRVQTMLDGTFNIPSVAPGTYFVLASMAGYITPLAVLGVSNEDLLEPTGELRKRIVDRVPTITVDASGLLGELSASGKLARFLPNVRNGGHSGIVLRMECFVSDLKRQSHLL